MRANERLLSGFGSTPARSVSSAGAVKDDDFKKAFTQVQNCQITSTKEVNLMMAEIRATLADANRDWDRRVSSLKMLRAVCLHAGEANQEGLVAELLNCEAALLTSLKDLRSQVCREACITVSFLCERFGNRIVKLAEAILPQLVPLVQNSAKVMASSASLACQYIVRNVQTLKIIGAVVTGTSSKSREIRRRTTDLIVTILQSWDPKLLEKSFTLIIDSIKSGLNDADPGARTAARAAYQLLDAKFPKQAQYLFETLEPSKQKALQGHVSHSSSTSSIVSEQGVTPFAHRLGAFEAQQQKPFYAGRSTSAIDPAAARRACPLPRRAQSPRPATPLKPAISTSSRTSSTAFATGRSASAIDSAAARRACPLPRRAHSPRPATPLKPAISTSSRTPSTAFATGRSASEIDSKAAHRALVVARRAPSPIVRGAPKTLQMLPRPTVAPLRPSSAVNSSKTPSVGSQSKLINILLNELNRLDEENTATRIAALHRLSQMLADGSLTLWEQHFKSLLFVLMEQTKIEDEMIQKLSLKLLSKICMAQAQRFCEYSETSLLRLLQLEETPAIADATEEFGRVLVTHLPTNVCIRTLISIIISQNEPLLSGALKWTWFLLKKVDVEAAKRWLPDIAPVIMQAYGHDSSRVRKEALACLVVLKTKIPEDVEPCLKGLEKAKLALLDLYVKKAQTSSNHF